MSRSAGGLASREDAKGNAEGQFEPRMDTNETRMEDEWRTNARSSGFPARDPPWIGTLQAKCLTRSRKAAKGNAGGDLNHEWTRMDTNRGRKHVARAFQPEICPAGALCRRFISREDAKQKRCGPVVRPARCPGGQPIMISYHLPNVAWAFQPEHTAVSHWHTSPLLLMLRSAGGLASREDAKGNAEGRFEPRMDTNGHE